MNEKGTITTGNSVRIGTDKRGPVSSGLPSDQSSIRALAITSNRGSDLRDFCLETGLGDYRLSPYEAFGQRRGRMNPLSRLAMFWTFCLILSLILYLVPVGHA